MRAVITVIGKDTVGILSSVSAICAEYNVNIAEVTQSILQDMFAMIMMVDISECKTGFSEFAEKFDKLSEDMNLSIHVMHEEIFNSMHRI